MTFQASQKNSKEGKVGVYHMHFFSILKVSIFYPADSSTMQYSPSLRETKADRKLALSCKQIGAV